MTDEFVFETTGNADTYGELFSDLAVGKSTTNRLTYNDDGGENRNFKITYCLNEGDVVYLRVRGYGWIETSNFIITISSENHTHDYTYSYLDYSSTIHKCNCRCGGYIYENHDFVSALGMRMCRYCGYSTQGNKPTINGFDDELTEIRNNFYFIPSEDDE